MRIRDVDGRTRALPFPWHDQMQVWTNRKPKESVSYAVVVIVSHALAWAREASACVTADAPGRQATE